jgi:hypothetical protein
MREGSTVFLDKYYMRQSHLVRILNVLILSYDLPNGIL